MERTVKLADTFTVTSREQEVTVDLTKLTDEIIARAAVHGLRQKISDAAASAATVAAVAALGDKKEGQTKDEYLKLVKAWRDNPGNEPAIADVAKSLMVKARDALLAGTWAAERQAGADAIDLVPINYALSVYAVRLAHDIEGWSTMKIAAKRDAVNDWLDAKEGRRATVMAKIEAEQAGLADI
jgi:hypothetical protein